MSLDLRTALIVIGRRLGHYLVLERLGGGGMGEVFVAQDTRLERQVALKLPRPEVADSPDRRARFQREARAAAALNHPNIVHVYSVEECDGLLFITMELVQGRSLREILRGRPASHPEDAGRSPSQMAEGLACAHAAGILHRDLKPANVMITDDDRVKILDFGLAKYLTPASAWDPDATTMARDASSPGMTLGTPGYMSPEQALGKTLDPRTDLFALGAVLFEMATGRPPFEGDTLAAVFDQLLNRRPPCASEPEPGPARVAGGCHREGAREGPRAALPVGTRAPAGPEGVEMLERPRRACGERSAAARTSPSIVVLPFVDMSPRKDQEYFCHGVTEEIISSLARVPGLARHLAHVGLCVPGQGARDHGDRQKAQGRNGARGQRSQGG